MRWLGFCLSLLPPLFGHAAEVLFDQGHGQRFVIERDGELELSRFAELWRQRGFQVTSSVGSLDAQPLDGVDAVVVSGAFTPFSAAERVRLKQFVEGGGVLLITLHVGPLNGQLLADFGIGVSNGVVLDQANALNANGSDFVAGSSRAHPLLEGVEQVAVYGVWALNPAAEGQPLFAASEAAWMDLNRNRRWDRDEPVAPFVLGVVRRSGTGAVVVLGDDAIFQNRYLQGGNQRLAANLISWAMRDGR